jgi:2-(1,2-epoxy-1,2-dihydrophenyl)acetyl-CoA isomerase
MGDQPMTAASVEVESRRWGEQGTVASLTLHSADGTNRLGHESVRRLLEALSEAAADGSVSLITIGSEGEAFCAGGDMGEFQRMDEAAFRGFMVDVMALNRTVATCGPPVLARVHGQAVGAGAALALSCDLLIASDDTKLAFPEARLGLASAGYLLSRLLTPQRAAAACFTARSYSARDLQELGLANAVVERSQLAAECDRWIATILRSPARGLRASKASLVAGRLSDTASAISQHIELQVAAFAHARNLGTGTGRP